MFTVSFYKLSLILLFTIFTLILPQKNVAQFVYGADIGWLSQMEATGYQFYNSDNVESDCLEILKAKGINTIRLRVFVNPSNDKVNGHCSKKEVATMALRAKNMGMRIMIDFHYSDTWADPANQSKPVAWSAHSFNDLLTDVYNHTYEVLDTLKSIGATPEWVQVGNEIAGGMLWPDGSTNNWAQLSQLLNKGYDAVKAIDNNIKVIIHLQSGNNNGLFRWFFDNATIYNVDYDIIGVSYYPFWIGSDYTQNINDLANNLNDMVERYGKEVMVVEVGGLYNQVQNTYDMLRAVINKVKEVPNNKGLGVLYWEPEGEKTWSGYDLNCWGSDGKPTMALDAILDASTGIAAINNEIGFSIYPNPIFKSILNIKLDGLTGKSKIKIFDIQGKLVREHAFDNQLKVSINTRLNDGIYLVNLYSQTLERTIFQKQIVVE